MNTQQAINKLNNCKQKFELRATFAVHIKQLLDIILEKGGVVNTKNIAIISSLSTQCDQFLESVLSPNAQLQSSQPQFQVQPKVATPLSIVEEKKE